MVAARVAVVAALCAITPALGRTKWFNSFAGPYFLIYGRMYDCQLGETGFDGSVTRHLRHSHHNPHKPYELQAMYSNVTRKLPVNDSFWYVSNAASWSNNQWINNSIIFHFKSKYCSAIHNNTDPGLFRALGGVFTNGTCEYKAGTFVIDGLKSDRRLKQFPQLPYGRYRVRETIGIIGEETVRGCAYTELQTTPRPNDQ